MESDVEGLIVRRLCSGGRRRCPRGCIVAQAGRQTCIVKADTTRSDASRRSFHWNAYVLQTGSWDKLPIAIDLKLTSGQIDGDGGDRVVSFLQHGAYSQLLKEASCTAACLWLLRVLTRSMFGVNSTNPIFYSVDAAIKRAPWPAQDTTLPLSAKLAHSIHTRLIVF